MINIKAGFFHWFLQRNTAIFLILSVILLLFLNYEFLNFVFLICFTMHLRLGFETLVNDYIHDANFKVIGLTFIRVLAIYILKFLFLITL